MDQRPRYYGPSGACYMDLMRTAVGLEFIVDPDTLDSDLLLSAQVRVNQRQAAQWIVSTTRRSREHSWNGDLDELLGLRLNSDLPRMYCPRPPHTREDTAEWHLT